MTRIPLGGQVLSIYGPQATAIADFYTRALQRADIPAQVYKSEDNRSTLVAGKGKLEWLQEQEHLRDVIVKATRDITTADLDPAKPDYNSTWARNLGSKAAIVRDTLNSKISGWLQADATVVDLRDRSRLSPFSA